MSANRTQADHAATEWIIPDPGDAGEISVGVTGVVELTTATAAGETRTLPDPPYVGHKLKLVLQTDGGPCTITAASSINVNGDTEMVLQEAGESIQLYAAKVGSDIVWRYDGE